jgi:hypothetical protein
LHTGTCFDGVVRLLLGFLFRRTVTVNHYLFTTGAMPSLAGISAAKESATQPNAVTDVGVLHLFLISPAKKKQGNQCGRYAGSSDPSNIDRHGEAFRPSTVSIPMGIVGWKKASMGDPWGSPVTVVFAPAEAMWDMEMAPLCDGIWGCRQNVKMSIYNTVRVVWRQ